MLLFISSEPPFGVGVVRILLNMWFAVEFFAGCTGSRQGIRRLPHPVRHHGCAEELGDCGWISHMSWKGVLQFSKINKEFVCTLPIRCVAIPKCSLCIQDEFGSQTCMSHRIASKFEHHCGYDRGFKFWTEYFRTSPKYVKFHKFQECWKSIKIHFILTIFIKQIKLNWTWLEILRLQIFRYHQNHQKFGKFIEILVQYKKIPCRTMCIPTARPLAVASSDGGGGGGRKAARVGRGGGRKSRWQPISSAEKKCGIQGGHCVYPYLSLNCTSITQMLIG